MANATELSFDAPIPGMSLTTEPGNRPWESPPIYTDVEDVIEHYIDNIGEETRSSEMMNILEQGTSINSLVDSLISVGVMKGLHTLESGLLASTVVVEYIQAMADVEGVKYKVSNSENKKTLTPSEKRKYEKLIEEELQKDVDEGAKSSLFMTGETSDTEEAEEVAMAEPLVKGLMARPVAIVAEVTEEEEST
tara:strand:- start:323 stop:901 length:579 start_codon:yes stop_codon:yes gene_type:complete